MENSITAGADHIHIEIDETHLNTHIKITITDNGKGMDTSMLEVISDPFVTTRTTRRVGFGIALFKAAAERCDGKFTIKSRKNQGTTIFATFRADHMDRAPLGNMGETITTIVAGYPDIDVRYEHILFKDSFTMDTVELKTELGGIELSDPAVLARIKEIINDFLKTTGT